MFVGPECRAVLERLECSLADSLAGSLQGCLKSSHNTAARCLNCVAACFFVLNRSKAVVVISRFIRVFLHCFVACSHICAGLVIDVKMTCDVWIASSTAITDSVCRLRVWRGVTTPRRGGVTTPCRRGGTTPCRSCSYSFTTWQLCSIVGY